MAIRAAPLTVAIRAAPLTVAIRAAPLTVAIRAAPLTWPAGHTSRSLRRRARSNHFRELSDRAGGLMAQPAAFGLNADPNAGGLAIAGRIAAIADSAGLEYVGIQDHPYNPEFLDTLTVITWLVARTSRVHLFPNVANLPLRPPAMLAKQAASIDMLSGGRLELGLGAGAFADGIAGMGGPRRTPGQARAALGDPAGA